MDKLTVLGYRVGEEHKKKIARVAKKRKVALAEALRIIISEYKV